MYRVRCFLCLAVFLLFFIPGGSAHSTSCNAEAVLPIPLGSDETADLVASMYREIGPGLGCTLVDANIVLTLAGYRGQTEFWIRYPEAGDGERLMSLEKLLGARDMHITKPLGQRDGHSIMSLIYNFRGIERCTKRSRIPLVSPYEASSGYKGYGLWFKENCERAAREGVSSDERDAIREGVLFGYPDVAIVDFIQWMASGNPEPLPQTDIACVRRYQCPEPNFAFGASHGQDPAIRETVSSWGTFLANFYATPWHRSLVKDAAFQAARRKHDDDGRRYAEELKKR